MLLFFRRIFSWHILFAVCKFSAFYKDTFNKVLFYTIYTLAPWVDLKQSKIIIKLARVGGFRKIQQDYLQICNENCNSLRFIF